MADYDGARVAKRMEGKTAEMLIDTTAGKDMDRGFTLICTFSRAWCVPNFFAAFNHLLIDTGNCHLLVIDNSDLSTLRDELLKRLNVYKDYFYSVRLLKTWRQGGTEMVTDTATTWEVGKLPYIYEMHKDMMELCSTKKFVLLEDDTIVPYKKHPDVVMRLLGYLDEFPECGIATAIETGRSSIPYVKTRLGVHYLERVGNLLLWRLSPNPKLAGLHSMDACGWYCCASYKHMWLAGMDGMDAYVAGVPRFAMDVMHTNNMKRLGFVIIADFSLWCAHMEHTSDRILFWGKRQALPQLDVWLPEWKEYAQGVCFTKPEHKRILANITRGRDAAWQKQRTRRQ